MMQFEEFYEKIWIGFDDPYRFCNEDREKPH
jgi:hypothetical protein